MISSFLDMLVEFCQIKTGRFHFYLWKSQIVILMVKFGDFKLCDHFKEMFRF